MISYTVKAYNRCRLLYGAYKVRKLGFWFVDIPRTSSTSIKHELCQKYGVVFEKGRMVGPKKRFYSGIFHPHITAQRMCEILGEQTWNSLYTFSIIRNPYERMYSFFLYRIREERIPADTSYEEYLSEVSIAKSGGKSSKFSFAPLHYYSCRDFILDSSGNLMVDHIIDFKERRKGLAAVFDKLGIDDIDLDLKMQKTDYPDTVKIPRPDLVYEMYKDDFEYFGYLK